jgi:hypothetical protein
MPALKEGHTRKAIKENSQKNVWAEVSGKYRILHTEKCYLYR